MTFPSPGRVHGSPGRYARSVFLFGGHNNAIYIGKDQCHNHNNLYTNILTYEKNMHFEKFSRFSELDLLYILGIGDIRIGNNFHVWTKSRIMLTKIYILSH